MGVGAVGAATAFDILMNQICDELVLSNRNKEKVWAEATDLQHSLGYSGNKMVVKDGKQMIELKKSISIIRDYNRKLKLCAEDEHNQL